MKCCNARGTGFDTVCDKGSVRDRRDVGDRLVEGEVSGTFSDVDTVKTTTNDFVRVVIGGETIVGV